MSTDQQTPSKQKRRAVLKTAWLLVAVVLAIYLFFIGRAFLQGLG